MTRNSKQYQNTLPLLLADGLAMCVGFDNVTSIPDEEFIFGDDAATRPDIDNIRTAFLLNQKIEGYLSVE